MPFTWLEGDRKARFHPKRFIGDTDHMSWYLRSHTPARLAKENRATTAQKAGSEGLINFVLPGPVLNTQGRGTGIPNSGLRQHRQEEDSTTLLYPTSLPANGFSRPPPVRIRRTARTARKP